MLECSCSGGLKETFGTGSRSLGLQHQAWKAKVTKMEMVDRGTDVRASESEWDIAAYSGTGPSLGSAGTRVTEPRFFHRTRIASLRFLNYRISLFSLAQSLLSN